MTEKKDIRRKVSSKPKISTPAKDRITRITPARPTSTSRKTPLRGKQTSLRRLESLVLQTREQISFVYGAIEEIAERQQIQSSWQMDLARQFFSPDSSDRGDQEVEVFTDLEAMNRLAFEAGRRQAAVTANSGGGDEAVNADGSQATTGASKPGAMVLPPQVAAELAYIEDVLHAAESAHEHLDGRNRTRRNKGIEILRRQAGVIIADDTEGDTKVFVVPTKYDLH